MFGDFDVSRGGVDNAMCASLQCALELKQELADVLSLICSILTSGMISAGSVTSRCARSSLKEMRCPTSTSQ